MFKKLISAVLSMSMIISLALPVNSVYANTGEADAVRLEKKEIPLQLYYDEEAPFGNEGIEKSPGASSSINSPLIESEKDDGWERWSIPMGNGYFASNLFGRTESERVQITERTLANPYKIAGVYLGGLNNFSETYIDFGHPFSNVSDYSRTLDINNAVSAVNYVYNGVKYSREYFMSYPDRAMVIKLDADTDGALNFTLRPTIPWEQDYANTEGDGASKHGQVIASVENGVGKIELTGKMGYYDVDFMGIYKVITDGTGTLTYNNGTSEDGVDDGTVTVSGGKSAYIIITLGTDYELCTENIANDVGSKPIEKTDLTYTRAKVEGYMSAIDTKISGMAYDASYTKLKDEHIRDYTSMYGRAVLDINALSDDYNKTTDQLLTEYKAGTYSKYLETVMFQYGRYLLLAASRPGTLPPNLQGAWNRYNETPWSAGYWHNINVQMNYWPAFTTNLRETFEAYNAYNDAYMPLNQTFATENIKKDNPSALGKDGGNGWALGISGWLYTMNNDQTARAPGNMGFLTKLYWDWYQFTQDEELLREVVYPKLADAARFITKCVVEQEDGKLLVPHTDSAEQYRNGEWYFTKGTTYAQSSAYQTCFDTLLAAQELGIDLTDESLLSQEDYSILKTVMAQLDKYDPIIVGLSGQVKEFREEEYYGDIGEKNHRHISNLVGLAPGTHINSSTPAWLDAAKVTLDGRGDLSQSWAMAHRINLWARAKEGNQAYHILNQLFKTVTATNLWTLHPPFQIDGNYGTTAGIAEMLLQSHEGYIEILPAVPDAWADGQFTGLVARGNFEVSAKWENNTLKTVNLKSLAGGEAKVKYDGVLNPVVKTEDGDTVTSTVNDGVITFNTQVGKTYYIGGFTKLIRPNDVTNLVADNEFVGDTKLRWTASADAASYNVYYAKDSDKDYTKAGTVTSTEYTFTPEEGEENARYTFKVMAVNSEGTESKGKIVYRNPEDVSATANAVVGSVLEDGALQVTVNATEFESSYKLYKKTADADKWTFVKSSDIPVITMENYDVTMDYGVSVVSRYYDTESEIVKIEDYGVGADRFIYDVADILENAKVVTNSSSSAYESVIDLPATFNLGELKLYDYNASATSANYAGAMLKIETSYNGEWTTVHNLTSNADIKAKRVGSYLSFDMDGIKAQRLRITATPVSGNTVKFNDITLSGVHVKNEQIYKENVFEGYKFIPSNDAARAQILNDTFTYDNLTDGSYKGSANALRFSSKTDPDALLDGTLDFGGKAVLNELRLYDYNAYDNEADYAGQSIKVQVCNGGEWSTVKDITLVSGAGNNIRLQYRRELNKRDELKDKWLAIDLGGVSAEKIRVICDDPTSKNKITYWEFECSGFVGESSNLEASDNLFKGKKFTLTDESAGYVLGGSYGVENLTDGTYCYSDNPLRFATTTNANAILDATLDFGANAVLNELLVYDYSSWDNSANYAGTDVTVYGYNNGAWTELFSETLVAKTDGVTGNVRGYRGILNARDELKDKWLVFPLGGAEATKIRVVFDNPASGYSISLWELECTGSIENSKTSTELTDSNVLANITPVTSGKEVTYDLNGGESLCTMNIDMATTTATADVEVLVDNIWIKLANDVSLNSNAITKVDLYGTNAQKVKVTFSDISGLKGISCTTTKKAIERTELVNAFNAIPSVDNIGADLLDEYIAQVGVFRTYLADTTATQDIVDSYTAEIKAYDWDALVDIAPTPTPVPTPEPTPVPTPVPTEGPVDYIINYEFTDEADATEMGSGTQVDGVGGKSDKVMQVTGNSTRNYSRYFESTTGYMTYETEFYMTNPSSDRFVFQVFNQSGANRVRSGFDINAGVVKYNAFGTGTFWETFTQTDATLKGGWNKVAITWDMANTKMLFYLNDEKIAEGTVTEMNGTFGGDVGISDTTANNVYVDNFRVYAEEYYIAPTPEEFGVNFVTSEINEKGELILTYNVSGFATQSESLLKFFLAEKDGKTLLNLYGADITGDGEFDVNVGKTQNADNLTQYIWMTNLTPVE